MRIPGVIGGLGPQTTADFYLRLQELANERKLAFRPPSLTWSVPLPLDLEEQSIIEWTGFDEIAEYLADAAQHLEKGGADFVVMPCNSLHLVQQRISDSIGIPFISILDETVKAVTEHGYKKVALLATGQTVHNRLYENPLNEAGVEAVKPSPEQQARLSEMVVRLINGRVEEMDKQEFAQVVAGLRRAGAECVLLGCTDFHLVYDQSKDFEFIDTVEVLAQATVREMLSDS